MTSSRPERVRRRWPTIRLSSTEALSNRVVDWKVRAMPRRATSSVRSVVMSRPSKVIVPSLGLCTPLMRLKKVVLPAPLGPMMALILPFSMLVLTLLTAVLPPKRLVRCSISSTCRLLWTSVALRWWVLWAALRCATVRRRKPGGRGAPPRCRRCRWARRSPGR